jgi:hypothetical protein
VPGAGAGEFDLPRGLILSPVGPGAGLDVEPFGHHVGTLEIDGRASSPSFANRRMYTMTVDGTDLDADSIIDNFTMAPPLHAREIFVAGRTVF